MNFTKKHWLYAGILVMLICVSLGAFLAWRASQPVETKRVYALPEPNPKRAEILKRALQPPKRAYAPKASSDEVPTDNTTAESLEADSGEPSSQENDFEDEDLEEMLTAIDEELKSEEHDHLYANQPIIVRHLGIVERMKTFRNSSGDYQQLNKQFESISLKHNQLNDQINEVGQLLATTYNELISIPVLTEEQREKIKQTVTRRKAQMRPEEAQEVLKLVQMAEERGTERKNLEGYYKELVDRQEQLTEERKLINSQMKVVTQAMVRLYRQNGLPGTHAELRDVLQKENEQ